MITILKILLTAILIFFILFVLIIAPLLITATEAGIHPDFNLAGRVLKNFIIQINEGNFYTFLVGKTFFNIKKILGTYILNSTAIALTSSVIGLLIGFLGGMIFSRYRRTLELNGTALLSFIPDFFLAIVLQFIVLLIISNFHGFPIKVVAVENLIFFLPVLTISVTSSSYLIISIHGFINNELGKNYIIYAHSKGLSKNSIFITHLSPAVIVHLKHDLFKYLSLVFANLLIIERIFNLKGLSRLLFSFAYPITGNFNTSGIFSPNIMPQLNIALTGIVSIIAIFFFVYLVLYITLLIMRRILTGEQ
jgi:ABC-type dipeptide/oligopeptide/nickel transport system permease component